MQSPSPTENGLMRKIVRYLYHMMKRPTPKKKEFALVNAFTASNCGEYDILG